MVTKATVAIMVLTGDDDASAAANSYFRNINIYEDYDDNMECATPLALDICVQLEGAYNILTQKMTSKLEALNILPVDQPYNQVPWNYNGAERRGIIGVVDWVLVSFRTNIYPNTEVARTAALLKTDGCIYFPDSQVLPAGFNTPVYIVVEHRNHIGVMSPQRVNITNNTLSYDFSATQSYKNGNSFGQKRQVNGTWCMYVGEMQQTSAGYDINGADKGIWVKDNGIFNQYLLSDLNQDGDVKRRSAV